MKQPVRRLFFSRLARRKEAVLNCGNSCFMAGVKV